MRIFFAAACIFNTEWIEESHAAWCTRGQNCMDNTPDLKTVNTVKIFNFQNLCAQQSGKTTKLSTRLLCHVILSATLDFLGIYHSTCPHISLFLLHSCKKPPDQSNIVPCVGIIWGFCANVHPESCSTWLMLNSIPKREIFNQCRREQALLI